ncbi:hypothetical protein PC121_g5941 [Phytophthora cactorum]|nr:hypothetical protein PC120_g11664 [Phytophthora cactorum]KAG3082841.1 hypothetical protein PC121_g5941 [Phytophthora cactorum]
MLQFISPSEDAAEIERFRARHRRLLRPQQQQQSPAKVEALDEDDGRRRKISANWRRKQQQVTHQSDSQWCQSIGTGDGLNAFDFTMSPEAFHDEPVTPVEPCAALQDEQRMADVARQVTSMGFHCGSMWSRTGPSHWGPPTSYATCVDQRRTLYNRPQYYG